MEYKMKDDVVFVAAQWTAKNYEEMVEVTGNSFNQGADEDGPWAEVFWEDEQHWIDVFVGDYVVFLDGKLLAVLSDGDFDRYFIAKTEDLGGLMEGSWNK